MASEYQKRVRNGSEMSPDYHIWSEMDQKWAYQKRIKNIKTGVKSSQMDPDYQKWSKSK